MGSDEEDFKYTDKNTGKKYRFKLAWCEDKKSGIWNVAYGNTYYFTTSGIIVFQGAYGAVVISPSIDYTIK
jgi:hypothetical protein